MIAVLVLALTSCKTSDNRATVDIGQYASELADHRTSYLADFIRDPRSPLDSTDLQFIKFFDPDVDYLCTCAYDKYEQPQPFPMATYAGTVQEYIKVGTVTCPLASQSITVELYQNMKMLRMPMYRNRYFLPFRDHTNGEMTYGGGRYIDLKVDTIIDNSITIDFNKAYNPWCAYSDGYACPIPPVANHIDLPIIAGEAAYVGPHKVKED
jgi:uncharacterized protein (DUF1684 family)